jgi:hypothetical protein
MPESSPALACLFGHISGFPWETGRAPEKRIGLAAAGLEPPIQTVVRLILNGEITVASQLPPRKGERA